MVWDETSPSRACIYFIFRYLLLWKERWPLLQTTALCRHSLEVTRLVLAAAD